MYIIQTGKVRNGILNIYKNPLDNQQNINAANMVAKQLDITVHLISPDCHLAEPPLTGILEESADVIPVGDSLLVPEPDPSPPLLLPLLGASTPPFNSTFLTLLWHSPVTKARSLTLPRAAGVEPQLAA